MTVKMKRPKREDYPKYTRAGTENYGLTFEQATQKYIDQLIQEKDELENRENKTYQIRTRDTNIKRRYEGLETMKVYDFPDTLDDEALKKIRRQFKETKQ